MNGSFQNYIVVLCGAGLAFLVTIISSAIFAAFNIVFREKWLLIIFFSSIAIIILLLIFQRSIGISFEERTLNAQNIENIMVNFEERIKRIFKDNTKVEVIGIWKIEISVNAIIFLLSIFIPILIFYFILSFTNLLENKIIFLTSMLWPFLILGLLRIFVRKRLLQYVCKIEYYWRFRSILLRDPRECHVEFYSDQNIIKVKYFYERELFRAMMILEDSGLPLRIRSSTTMNILNN